MIIQATYDLGVKIEHKFYYKRKGCSCSNFGFYGHIHTKGCIEAIVKPNKMIHEIVFRKVNILPRLVTTGWPRLRNNMIIDIKHITQIAKITLTKEEEIKYPKQLSQIIEYVDKLIEIDTTKVIPTAQPTGLENITREDIVKPSFSQEEALSNGKKTYKGFFVTDRILWNVVFVI